ncbi:hypothetical protein [Streptomyces sp. CRN 30]|uniref:hypothetical protein n=1 Tax=Streptomyces sp. CRN 30 TaxID=3075613 RepID=UPI002A82E742|nr:hypothetical protein [Streptomyces sp. CRN 30]
MFGGRGGAVALACLALVGPSLVWAPAGQAHPVAHSEGVRCTGSSTSTYDPPLNLTPRATRVHTRAEYECGIAPGRIVAATSTLEGTSPTASCIALGSPRLTETVRYADGTRSEIVYEGGTTVRVAGVLVVLMSGRVVEGQGEGQAARRIVPALPAQLPTRCLTSGVTGSNGVALLEIGR